MRYLGIDLGGKRTGLASGDDETGIVSALEVVTRSDPDLLLDDLAERVHAYGPDALVLGLPLNADGTEGDAARGARAFAERLAARTQLPVHLQDERLTSFAAEQHLNRSGRTRGAKKAVRDAIAAAEILRDFLEQHA